MLVELRRDADRGPSAPESQDAALELDPMWQEEPPAPGRASPVRVAAAALAILASLTWIAGLLWLGRDSLAGLPPPAWRSSGPRSPWCLR
jgi:hypothetical protein